MSLEETYEWAKKQREAWDANKLANDGIKRLDSELVAGGDHPVVPVKFRGGQFAHFYGEAAEVRGDLIFHIWPSEPTDDFADTMGDVFIEVFRFEDRLSADWVPELRAWAVKVAEVGNSLSRNELVDSLFTKLNAALTDEPG